MIVNYLNTKMEVADISRLFMKVTAGQSGEIASEGHFA